MVDDDIVFHEYTNTYRYPFRLAKLDPKIDRYDEVVHAGSRSCKFVQEEKSHSRIVSDDI